MNTTVLQNSRGKAPVHSKPVGSTQAFTQVHLLFKRERKKAKGTRAQHLMKKVGRKKPESTWLWYPVVPMGQRKQKALKEKSRSKVSGDAEKAGLQVHFCPPSPAWHFLPQPPGGTAGLAQPAWVLRARTQSWANLRREKEKAKQGLTDRWQGHPTVASSQPHV